MNWYDHTGNITQAQSCNDYFGKYEEYFDDAYVSGNMMQLMPQVPGMVIEINAQLVRAGKNRGPIAAE